MRYNWVITAAPCRLAALLEQQRGLLRRAVLRLLVLRLQREQGPQLPVMGLHAGGGFAPSATPAVDAAVPQRGGAGQARSRYRADVAMNRCVLHVMPDEGK